jgi:hypothetical protein
MTKKKLHPLKQWRMDNKYSQQWVAERCSKILKRKVHSSVISNIEQGIEPMLTLATAITQVTYDNAKLDDWVEYEQLSEAVIPVSKRK